MDGEKRSVRETITQLIVIAILIALIIGSVIFLRQYIDSRSASDGVSGITRSLAAVWHVGHFKFH